jgi:hypothetical protein
VVKEISTTKKRDVMKASISLKKKQEITRKDNFFLRFCHAGLKISHCFLTVSI